MIAALIIALLAGARPAFAEGWDLKLLPRPGAKPSDSLFSTATIDEASKDKSFDWNDLANSLLGSKVVAPTGAQSDPVSEECLGRNIERRVLAAHGDLKKISAVLHEYQQKCDGMLSRNNHRGLTSLRDLENIQYDPFSTPGVSAFRLKTPANEDIFGVMARKEGRRPWVIVKCGIFCEADNNATMKNMVLHLYEEAPFNLIILNNQTSPENILANQHVSFGGFYEGQEMMTVAYWLKYASPFAADVAAIHGMGISLGGNAALFASLYNDRNRFEGEKLFSSMVAYCPAANMGPTVAEVFRDTIKGLLFSLKTWGVMKRASSTVSDVRDILPSSKPKIKKYPELIAAMSTKFLSRIDPSSFLKPFQFNTPISDVSQFWQLNNFTSYSDGLETPTLVWASQNDWVVENGLNAGALEVKHNSDPNTNLRVVNMDYGNHCAKSMTYGWQAVSSILRGFYLGYTNPVKFQSEEITVPLNFSSSWPRLDTKEIIAGYEWNARPGDDNLILDVKTWEPIEDAYNGCGSGYGPVPSRNFKPFTTSRECYNHKTVRVPLRSLASLSGVDATSLMRAETNSKAEALTRYLNSHFELWSSSGSIIGKQTTPNQLHVRSYSN